LMFGPVPKGPSEGGEVLVNNNKNKSPVPGGYMSNTIHKTGERSFKEERRDVMTMNKFFTGLIALVAGVALSAGSAFATKGVMAGDPAMMKLVPYYETGSMKATIIGIQNLSPREAATTMQHQVVMDIQAYLDMAEGGATTNAVTALAAEDVTIDEGAMLMEGDLNTRTAAEAALETAQMAVLDEYVFVAVNVYDSMGMMMENASAELCLKEHQFGYVVLQGPADMGTDGHQGAVLSVMDGDIPAYGYVEIAADMRKYSACESASFRDPVMSIDIREAGTEAGQLGDQAEDAAPVYIGASSMVAAWTIIQDVGMGFFGTEVPTSTISRMADMPDTDMDESMMTNCYNASDAVEDPEVFNMSMCGLIPERHDNSRVATGDAAGDLIMTGEDGGATARANAIARYDAGDESMVYVWLAEGMDTENTHPSNARMLDVVVKCEDGTVMTGMDQYGDPTDAIAVAAPGMLTMIDPTMGDVGDNVAMCTGDRGVLRITIPDGSKAGAVFSHVTQMGGHYRMNFPGYSKADPTSLPAP
jgi:hypothetical protein